MPSWNKPEPTLPFYWSPQDSNRLLVGIHCGVSRPQVSRKSGCRRVGDLQSHAQDPLKGFTKTFSSNKQDSALKAGRPRRKETEKGSPNN